MISKILHRISSVALFFLAIIALVGIIAFFANISIITQTEQKASVQIENKRKISQSYNNYDYIIAFKFNDGSIKELEIDEEIYNSITKGETGKIVYKERKGSKDGLNDWNDRHFIGFEKDQKYGGITLISTRTTNAIAGYALLTIINLFVFLFSSHRIKKLKEDERTGKIFIKRPEKKARAKVIKKREIINNYNDDKSTVISFKFDDGSIKEFNIYDNYESFQKGETGILTYKENKKTFNHRNLQYTDRLLMNYVKIESHFNDEEVNLNGKYTLIDIESDYYDNLKDFLGPDDKFDLEIFSNNKFIMNMYDEQYKGTYQSKTELTYGAKLTFTTSDEEQMNAVAYGDILEIEDIYDEGILIFEKTS